MSDFELDLNGHIQFRPSALVAGALSRKMMEAEQALLLASGKGGLKLAGPASVVTRHPYAHLLSAYRKGLASANELGDTPLALAQLSEAEVKALSFYKLLVAQDIRLLPTKESRGHSFALAPIDASAEAKFHDNLAALTGTLGPSWLAFIGILSTITFVEIPSIPGLTYFSGSSNLTFGAMHMVKSDNAPILAECITHEAAHTWLGLVDGQDRLARDMWNEGNSCISPWREDPRPIGGVIHGVFVFSCVLVVLAKLLVRLSAPGEGLVLRKRMARISSQVEEGIVVLRASGLLTEAGEHLTNESQARLQGTLAFVSEYIDEARSAVRESCRRKLVAMRSLKEHSHG